MKTSNFGLRRFSATAVMLCWLHSATNAQAAIEAHGLLVENENPAMASFSTDASGMFSVPYTVQSANTNLIVVGLYIDNPAGSPITGLQFNGVSPAETPLTDTRATLAYFSTMPGVGTYNITGDTSLTQAVIGNGYVWELSGVNLGSGVDSATMGSGSLPIETSITTSSDGRLVTNFFGGNKQNGTLAPSEESVVVNFTGLQFGGGAGGTVAGGAGLAGPAGPNALGWVAATGQAGNSIAELAYAFDAPGTVVEFFRLFVDRATGQITFTREGAAIENIVGYSITSAAGALNQSAWNTIADNYDGAGPVGGGEWTKLTQANSVSDFSEFTFDVSTPDGGQFPSGSLALGGNGAWLRTPIQDLQMTVKLSDGSNLAVPVKYSGPPVLRSDFDHDGDIDGDDFQVFLDNYNTDISPTLPDARLYLLGDLDGNQLVNIADFRTFKGDYLAYATGVGAEVGDLLLPQVPEPNTLLLCALAIGCLGRETRSRRSSRRQRCLEGRF
jgi:hypothetical protein